MTLSLIANTDSVGIEGETRRKDILCLYSRILATLVTWLEKRRKGIQPIVGLASINSRSVLGFIHGCYVIMIGFKVILYFKFFLNDLNLWFGFDRIVHLGCESHLIFRLRVSIFRIDDYSRVNVLRFNVLLRPLN